MSVPKRLLFGSVIVTCLVAIAPQAIPQSTPQAAVTTRSPNEVLRSAKIVYIRTETVFFKPATLENSLLQREEFQGWNIALTRNKSEADLIIEVSRKAFTSSFIFSVIDPETSQVVASGRVNSIGGTVEGKISDSLVKRLRIARQVGPSSTK